MNPVAKTPMREDAIFRIASMTKPFASLAIMMLSEEGKLSIADPVHKYLPERGADDAVAAGTASLPLPAAPDGVSERREIARAAVAVNEERTRKGARLELVFRDRRDVRKALAGCRRPQECGVQPRGTSIRCVGLRPYWFVGHHFFHSESRRCSGSGIQRGNKPSSKPAHAACLIRDSAGIPRPLCSFHTMAIVSGRLRLSTS